MRNPISLAWLALMVGVSACSGNPTSAVTGTFVANVVPSGGSAGVSTGSVDHRDVQPLHGAGDGAVRRVARGQNPRSRGAGGVTSVGAATWAACGPWHTSHATPR